MSDAFPDSKKPPARGRMELFSPYPPEECIRRISEGMQIIENMLLRSRRMGDKPVIGTVNGFTVRLRKRIHYRNSFQTMLVAVFSPHGSGSRISCELGMHTFVRVFMIVWLTAAVGIGGPIAFAALKAWISTGAGPKQPVDILMPVGMPIFGIVLLLFGQHLARDENAFLLQFLEETVQASATPHSGELPPPLPGAN